MTYFRPEDALAAIRTVNNLQIDGRTLKASLGTTKYCSHFLKNTQCLKPVRKRDFDAVFSCHLCECRMQLTVDKIARP